MAGRKLSRFLDNMVYGLAILSLACAAFALAFWPYIPRANRELVILLSSEALVGNLICSSLLRNLHLRQSKRRWQRSMAAWRESANSGKTPEFRYANSLTDGSLRLLALHVYFLMGYSIADMSDEGVGDHIIKCVNPDGKVELVNCRQKSEPVQLNQILRVKSMMDQEKAVRAFIWAPGGFSNEAIHWVKDRPIVLADSIEIGRIVDSTRTEAYDLSGNKGEDPGL